MVLSMCARARGVSSRRRPCERANALVRMQAGNAEAATSAGLPQTTKSEAVVTQECLFEDAEVKTSSLTGLRLRLEGEYARGCCKNIAIVHAGKGPNAAELHCTDCGTHCGWLPKAAANWLLDILAFWPEAKREMHVLRSVKGTDSRGSGLW